MREKTDHGNEADGTDKNDTYVEKVKDVLERTGV